MTKVTGGYIAPGSRLFCLVAICGLAFSPLPTAADVIPTVNAVDEVGAGGIVPFSSTSDDLITAGTVTVSGAVCQNYSAQFLP